RDLANEEGKARLLKDKLIMFKCQVDMKPGKANVTWEAICLPKHEGGLGILRIERFNVALMTVHICSLLTLKESHWTNVVWFAHCAPRHALHVWRELQRKLKKQDLLRQWDVGMISRIDKSCNIEDTLTNVVWFAHCAPRHALHVWRELQRKLKKQDLLRQWDVGPSTDLNLSRCLLCEVIPNSHDNLFFDFHFSSQKSQSTQSIISKLFYLARVKCKTWTKEQVVEVIISNILLKLLTFKFKKAKQVERVFEMSKLLTSLIMDSSM
ncbi:hypothetical protein Tco_0138093, partial [Tanacetum coccineum]